MSPLINSASSLESLSAALTEQKGIVVMPAVDHDDARYVVSV